MSARRLTQGERSAAMRTRLLDATVDCLVTYGYAGTTTSRVAERAGVTRGAQVHHFPTKADLVTAAIRHLALKRADAVYGRLEDLRTSDDVVGEGLDLLWELHQGPVFTATLELWVAARADPELRQQVLQVEPLIAGTLTEFSKVLFPPLADHPQFRHWAYTAMEVMRGILAVPHEPGDEHIEQRWQRARQHLRLLAEALRRGEQVSPPMT
ncbi:TetR/AcrR family transcriptional regulator [Qaidamihabitans albus]|uniref:TetR/AcrR family transcriptional regulator n=1 Tax=Qaidamihabitans albus TaxID=2795733 RepID=UPI0027DC036D|nr:helix-turn-helix domain-containing protein [Qaidamihabitans albus]